MNFFKKLFSIGKPVSGNDKTDIKPNPVKDIEEEFKNLMAALSKHKRTAYIPQVKVSDKAFNSKSKIGGLPYLRNEDDWPVCPNCQQNMQLFLQLNLSELPVNKSDGLAQLFYCTNDDAECEFKLGSFEPFSEGVVCRKVEINGPSAEVKYNLTTLFEEKVITNWQPQIDYPHTEEYETLGIGDLSDEVLDLMEQRNAGNTLEGDKLFGWPYWVQNEEYPFDRKSGAQMNLLFQLDSEVNLPYMFGDCGVGHLTQSPDNEEELAFGWACH